MLDNVALKQEMKRRQTKRITLLGYLEKHGSITTADLWRFGGTGASSRLHELRKAYHISKAIYLEPGLYKYVFKGKKGHKRRNAGKWDEYEDIR